MPTRISEKNFAIAILCFLASLIILLNTTLFAVPVRVSEKGLCFVIVAFIALMVCVRYLKRSAKKV
jgi:hypothetical protein